jgi:hypothetical protein
MTTSIIARVNDVDILLFKGEKELIPIKPICMALGIDFASQFQKIVIHPILRNVVYKEYMVGADNKKRKMICMPLDHILIWLLSICYKNVNKDAIKPLLTTQMNLYYNFFTIEGVKLTDEAVDLLYDLQDDENSNIESLLNGIYEVEEIVLNPEAGVSYGERLVMMQTLRDIRHLLDLLKVRSAPGH